MMLDLRSVPLRSWLNPQTAGSLSHAFRSRLEERMSGVPGLFITLTYERSDHASPLALYRAQSAERHVRRFISRLESYLGVSLNGRWCRKMEFQRGGWVHWHLVLDYPAKIPHRDLAQLWGHGFVFVSKIKGKHLRYMAKYAAKTGEMPGFLLGERVRAIKIVATSPGFWLRRRKSSNSPKRPPCPLYIPLGMRLAKPPAIVLRNAAAGWFRTFNVDLAELCSRMRAEGIRFVPGKGPWMGFVARWRDVVRVASQLEAETNARPATRSGGAGFTRSLYRNPPPEPPAWLADFLECEGGAGWETEWRQRAA